MASISHLVTVAVLAIVCLHLRGAIAIKCFHNTDLKSCHSSIDTCFNNRLNKNGMDIKLSGCYKEGETLDFGSIIGKVKSFSFLIHRVEPWANKIKLNTFGRVSRV